MTMIRRVFKVTKASACMLKEMVIPRSSVIRLARAFWAVSDSVPKTPHSRSRFPNIKKPTSATEVGAISPTIKVTTMGKAILTLRDTWPG